MTDAADRIRENRERLEGAAADAKAIISERNTVRDDVEAVAARVLDMGAFVTESEVTERRAFVMTFVRETIVSPMTPYCTTPSPYFVGARRRCRWTALSRLPVRVGASSPTAQATPKRYADRWHPEPT